MNDRQKKTIDPNNDVSPIPTYSVSCIKDYTKADQPNPANRKSNKPSHNNEVSAGGRVWKEKVDNPTISFSAKIPAEIF